MSNTPTAKKVITIYCNVLELEQYSESTSLCISYIKIILIVFCYFIFLYFNSNFIMPHIISSVDESLDLFNSELALRDR